MTAGNVVQISDDDPTGCLIDDSSINISRTIIMTFSHIVLNSYIDLQLVADCLVISS